MVYLMSTFAPSEPVAPALSVFLTVLAVGIPVMSVCVVALFLNWGR